MGVDEVKYEELGKGILRRRERKRVGLFIDGTGLDRATRRINRKVDMSALVRGVTSGTSPAVLRYYTLIPNEDDSRQRAFLDAVARAGLSVIVKRLPPKGVTRQVSVDLEIAADIVAFALGHSQFSDLGEYKPTEVGGMMASRGSALPSIMPSSRGPERRPALEAFRDSKENTQEKKPELPTTDQNGAQIPESRSIIVVCPSRELTYPISLIRQLGVDTTTADFGQFNVGDILKAAAKWVDLSDSETIWRDA